MNVIPIYISAGISGFESPAAEYKELGLSLDELLIENPNATFIGLAQGDSMEGHGIFEGDMLIVDRSKNVKHLDVIVANYNGCFVCKIIDMHSRCLLSSSPKHKPVLISSADTFQVEGTVPYAIRVLQKNSRLIPFLL
jgi:DNA polymerase V